MLATWGCTTFPKPTLSLDFLGATSLDSGITFSRGSQATLFDSTGTLVYAKHNLLLQSQTFQTTWATSTASVSADAGTAPDGTVTADKVIPDNAATGRVQQTFATTTGVTYTFSCFVKAAEFGWVALGMAAPGAYFNLSGAGAVGTTPAGYTASITSVGSGWYRCVVTLTESGGASRTWRINPASADNTLAVGDGTSGILVWGAQLNLANMEGGVTSSLSTYYPTTTAAYYAPRFDYNPSTLQPRGLLIEEQRTNSIRNNTMVGAVAGTPGTMPTNWSTFTTRTGLTREIVGTGTENGITYIDIRISGTPNTSGNISVLFETNTAVSAANAQNWAQSVYLKLQSGSFSGISSVMQNQDERSTTSYIRTNSSAPITITSQALSSQRFVFSSTLSGGATVAYLVPYLTLGLDGAAIDITLRIGLPQLELGAFATSVIPTTTTALTRNADVATMTGTNFSSWYNASEGTLFGEGAFLAISNSQSPYLVSIGDPSLAFASRNISASINRQASTANVSFRITSAGTNQLSVDVGSVAAATAFKSAIAYGTDNGAASLNGSVPTTDTSVTVPAVTTLILGDAGWSAPSGTKLNGWIGRIAYYPTRLPNATLVALTA